MPYLRQDGDTSLGDTLGNLGASLSSAFNPLKQIQAQSALSEIQARRWELQQKANIDAANRNAADVYERANPLNEDPASLAVTAAQIRAGQGDLGKTIDAVKAAGGYKANQNAAGLFAAAHPDWTPEEISSGQADLISGRKNVQEIETDRANRRLKENEATSTLAATPAAGAAAKTNVNPAASTLASEAAARGDVEGANKIIAQSGVLNADPNTPAFSPASQTVVTQQAIGGISPPAGQAPLIAQQPAYDAEAAQRKIDEANIAPHAPTLVREPQTIQFPARTPGGSTGTATVSGVQPDLPAQAATAANEAVATEQAKADVADVNTTIGEAASARNLDDKLDQLNELTKLYESMGAGNIDTQLIKYIGDRWGINYGTRAEIYKAMENLINDELPDARKAAGIQRLAAPEISATKLIIGAANLPPATLYNIIANEQGMARLSIQKGDLAQKAAAHQLTMDQYRVQKAAINSRIHETIEALRKQYGAAGTQKTPAPVQTTVQTPDGKPAPATVLHRDENGNWVQ